MSNVRTWKLIELRQILTSLEVIASAGTIPVVSGSMGEAIHLVRNFDSKTTSLQR